MAASEDTLGLLHQKIAERYMALLDSGEEIPATVLNAINAFLKNNSITCQIKADNALGELERTLAERRAKRHAGLTLVTASKPQDEADALEHMDALMERQHGAGIG